ncbi:hypothetical protein DXM29_20405 [Agrobacterium tumefaciens]|nr:hypothetical protein DXM29_20405 [Agrobacterium tumefaciens]
MIFPLIFLATLNVPETAWGQTRPSCEAQVLDANGALISKTDAKCRTTTHVRDGQGRVTNMTEAYGRTDAWQTITSWDATSGGTMQSNRFRRLHSDRNRITLYHIVYSNSKINILILKSNYIFEYINNKFTYIYV